MAGISVSSPYAAVDGLLSEGLQHKGNGENQLAASIFARAITALEALASFNPIPEILERLEDARHFAQRTEIATARAAHQIS